VHLPRCASGDTGRRISPRRGAVATVTAAVLVVILAAAAVASDTSVAGTRRSALRPKEPSKPAPLPGTGVVRFGTTFMAASGYERFSYVLVSRGDARAAARLPGTSLVYMSGTSVPPSWSTGVPYELARTNGWLLKDAGDHYLVNPNYGTYIGDIGNRAYQQAFVAGVTSFLAKTKVDGVFLDDVVASYEALTGDESPALYPNQTAWEAAMTSFVDYVGPALKARGYYVLANAGKFVPGNSNSDTAAYTTEFWQRIAPSVSGLMCEYWLQSPIDLQQIRLIGSQWFQNWTGWQQLVSVAQDAGVDFFGLMKGSGDNVQAMRFGRGSFLLDWNGGGGAFMYSITDRNDPYAQSWVTQFGVPVKPKFERVPGVWQRRYKRGLVVVNATSVPVTLRINGVLQTVAGGDALFSPNQRSRRSSFALI
jgi:Hypothetical glycosyl hydrolase family 15